MLTVHDFDDFTERLTDLILDYTRQRIALVPVPLDHAVPRDDLDARVGNLITASGNDPETVMDIFAEVLAPAVISVDSPRFLAFIPAAPTKAALLFDMVVSASSLQAISWLEAAGAIYAENQTLRFLADLAGLPAEAGGCFVSGGSAGNLSALVVARERATRASGDARPARWRIALSEQTHASVRNALHIMDVDAFVVPTVDERMTGPALAAALDADPDPSSVCAVVVTAGTTNAGIIEDVDGVGRVAQERGIWLHVDAAYGGAALLAPSVRDRFRGIERADSLVVDPHKWLYAPFDCAALLYRDPALARSVHTQDASYLDVIHDRPGEWNPSDYAFHLTRRARGLPLWFSLAVHGTDAYRDAVEDVLATARAAAARITAAPHVELVREPELSIVVFRRLGWNADDYERWSDELLTAQIAFVTPSSWHGETVARFAFLHPGTTLELVDEILETMQ
jgi:aromatic-L-amino-acid/L-tryptophan decarboxylase